MSIPASLLSPEAQKFLKNSRNLGSNAIQGIGCADIGESLPTYDNAQCERVYSGKNNTYLVFGRDRPGTQFSGCGGRGDTQCGMIDLVAGRISSVIMKDAERKASSSGTPPTSISAAARAPDASGNTLGINAAVGTTGQTISDLVVDNNFFADAARVYITQRAVNIDDYLGFKNEVGSDSTELSAVVVKSDCTRIVGRESVRIYAGGGAADGFPSFGEPRADGSDIDHPKIELIVGNKGEDDMHPAVLGYNLISYLTSNNEIQEVQLQIINSLIKQVSANTLALAGLTLGASSGTAAAAMVENVDNMRKMLEQQYNTAINDFNHLDKAFVPGKKSILSKKVYIT